MATATLQWPADTTRNTRDKLRCGPEHIDNALLLKRSIARVRTLAQNPRIKLARFVVRASLLFENAAEIMSFACELHAERLCATFSS